MTSDRLKKGEKLATPPRGEACPPVACKDCGIYQVCLPLGLDAADTALLDRLVKRREHYRRGEVLFRANEPFTHVFAVRSGSVKTCLSTDDGRVQITGFYMPGELLGLSALDSRVYSCEARALEPTTVCKVTAKCFDELAEKFPAIQHKVLCIMSNQIRHDEALMLLLGKSTAEERLATYLLSLSHRLALRHYPAAQFRLSMSRGDIGSYLGIAEETVCRVLARFHQEGVIASRRRLVHINDRVRLAAIARVGRYPLSGFEAAPPVAAAPEPQPA
jgi:CRP/FNR family transcriptional regulator